MYTRLLSNRVARNCSPCASSIEPSRAGAAGLVMEKFCNLVTIWLFVSECQSCAITVKIFPFKFILNLSATLPAAAIVPRDDMGPLGDETSMTRMSDCHQLIGDSVATNKNRSVAQMALPQPANHNEPRATGWRGLDRSKDEMHVPHCQVSPDAGS